MNRHMKNLVFKGLKQYVEEKSKYSPLVLSKPATDALPLVVITKITDKTVAINDPHSFVGFEVNIYAKDKEYEGEIISDIDICEELEDLVNEFMVGIMRFNRITNNSVPNIDNNINRIVMQFVTTTSDQRCRFF